jgi:hypothetical protein
MYQNDFDRIFHESSKLRALNSALGFYDVSYDHGTGRGTIHPWMLLKEIQARCFSYDVVEIDIGNKKPVVIANYVKTIIHRDDRVTSLTISIAFQEKHTICLFCINGKNRRIVDVSVEFENFNDSNRSCDVKNIAYAFNSFFESTGKAIIKNITTKKK